MYRKTWVEINLDALVHNYKKIKKIIGSSVQILAPVKADAYGHGIVEVSKTLENEGVDYLGVGAIDEGVVLRNSGVQCSILFLGSVLRNEIYAACKYKIALTVSSREHLELFNRIAMEQGTRLVVHVKVDTGMSRLGIPYEDVAHVLSSPSIYSHLIFEGLYTHFHSADDENPRFTYEQLDRFNKVVNTLQKQGLTFPCVHAANSMGLLHFSSSHFNFVRPGLMMYGLFPDMRAFQDSEEYLLPVLSFYSTVVLIKKVKAQETISYGRMFQANRDMRIAIIPVGYGDGYIRGLSDKAEVIINGQRVPVLGRVTMDQIIVDVTNLLDVSLGDKVVLIGSQEDNVIRAEELALLSNTITYEITCLISKRVPRNYIFNNNSVNLSKSNKWIGNLDCK